jgi:phage-related protein
MPYEVVVMESARGFLLSVGDKLQAKAFRAIDLLVYFGPQLRMPHSRKLSGYDLWELRVKQGSMICRLFYFHDRQRIYIVTSGYVKKSDETSPEEIQRALRLKAEYLKGAAR